MQEEHPGYWGQQGYEATPMQETPAIDWLQLAKDADIGSTSWFDTNVRRNMHSSLNQFNGKHEADSSYAHPFFKSRSKLFMPKTRSNIRKHEAMASAAFFSTMEIVEVSAYNDNDPLEKAAAEFYKEILNLRLTSSGPRSIPWFQTALGAYQDAMVSGICISFQDWDRKNNRPSVELISPENFRFDPACDWVNPIESSPYLIRKIPMRVGEIKRKIAKEGWLPVSDDKLAAARRPETDPVGQARNNGRTDPNQRTNNVKEFDIVWVNLNVINQLGQDYVYYTLGAGDAFLTEPTPLEQVYLHGTRPFVLGTCIIEAHKNYPSSIPQLTKDMQAYQNSLVNQRLDNARLAMDKRYFVRQGARVDHESITRNAPGSLTLVSDVEKDVKVVSTPDVNPSAYKEQAVLDIAMDDLVGGFNSATMQSNRSLNETVGGMSMISQSANQVAEYQLMVFAETWYAPVLRQLLAIEKHYETDAAVIAMAGANAELIKKYGQISFEDIQFKDMMLTVQVGNGATNPATKLEKFTMAMTAFAQAAPMCQQFGMDLKEVSKEIFGALGYRDGSRFFQEDVDPQVQVLQQQVQQLQQELANKRNPEVDAANVSLINAQAFKVRSDATFANIQTAQVLAGMPAIAPIADQVNKTNGFDDMQGENPMYEQGLRGMSGAMQSVGQQDPDALVAANEQANAYQMKGNTHPLSPLSGTAGDSKGIQGGQQ